MSSIIVYLFMVSVIFLFTYILGGIASMMLLYILLFAPLVSLLLTLFARKQLLVTVSISSSEVEKNGIITATVALENRTFIPIAFIDTTFIEASNFQLSDSPIIRCSLGAYKKMLFTANNTARQRGITKLGVEDVLIRDYLGIFSFSMLKYINKNSLYRDVTILPEIHKTSERCRILTNSINSENTVGMDECAVSLTSSSGEPGYECRDYYPGDSLCKIHWKLSAKRDKLMVRKVQGAGIKQKVFVLDPCLETVNVRKTSNKPNFIPILTNKESFTPSKKETLMVEEKVLETLLSLANTVIKTQTDIKLFLFLNNSWTEIQLKDLRDISKLQFLFASYEFSSLQNITTKERIPIDNMFENWNRAASLGNGEVILFTGTVDNALCSYVNRLESYGMKVDTVFVKSSEGYYTDQELNLTNLLKIETNDTLYETFT